MKKKIKSAERIQLEEIYKQQRKLLNQSIRRAQKSNWKIPQTNVRYAKEHMKPINQLTTAELKMGIKMVRKMRQSPIFSASGQKKIAFSKIVTLHKHGVDISIDELDEFGKFMDDLREWSLNRIFDSVAAVSLWDKMRNDGAHGKDIAKAYKEYVRLRTKTPVKTRKAVKEIYEDSNS